MRPSLLLSLALLLGACGPSKPPTLGTAERKLALLFPAVDETSDRIVGFEFALQYEWRFGDSCMVLSDQAKATVNGAPVEDLFRGAEDEVQDFVGVLCQPPSFKLPISAADAEELALVIEDGEDRVEAVALNPGRSLEATLTPPADGHIRAGSTLGLTWSPGTDKLDEMLGSVQSGGVAHFVGDFHQGLTLPNDLPPGPATLTIDQRELGVARCDGIERCDFGYSLRSDPQTPAPFRAVTLTFQIEP